MRGGNIIAVADENKISGAMRFAYCTLHYSYIMPTNFLTQPSPKGRGDDAALRI